MFADTTQVNQYLRFVAASKTVLITLITGATSANGGLNFDGGSMGDQSITVPAGWMVRIDVENHDVIPHSAIVIQSQTPLPPTPSKPAFSRAFTVHLGDGLPPQSGHDTMQFVANPAGQYLIACGVPGHAAGGMYVQFIVSPAASAPSDSGTIGPP